MDKDQENGLKQIDELLFSMEGNVGASWTEMIVKSRSIIKGLLGEKVVQTLEQNTELYYTQRVCIYFKGSHSQDTGRLVLVDSRVLYGTRRFSIVGKEEDMLNFAKRCGFNSINEFFVHYEAITRGEPFYGIIRFKDGFRWFEKEYHDAKQN